MAFPTTGIRDTFNRADTADINGSTWSDSTDTWGAAWSLVGTTAAIVSNQCEVPTTGFEGNMSTSNYGPDCEVYWTHGGGTFLWADIFFRWNSATNSGYYLGRGSGASTINVQSVAAGTETLILGPISVPTFTTGMKMGASMIGSLLTVYMDTGNGWVSIGSVNDSTYTGAGRIGFSGQSSGASAFINNFGGGTVVAGVQKTVFITSGTTYQIPADFGSLVAVHCIGAGGSGTGTFSPVENATGGGGGAYSKSTSVTGLTASATVNVQIGQGGAAAQQAGNAGTDTWFNKSAASAPAVVTDGALAKGGAGGVRATSFVAGGASGSGVGDTKFSGGNSGTIGGTSGTGAASGGGGAAGPTGAGAAGGGINSVDGGGGGGGADGGTVGANATSNGGAGGASGTDATAGGTGGVSGTSSGTAGSHGSGGGGGPANSETGGQWLPGAGGAGVGFTQTADSAVAGPGGGGGGSGGTDSGSQGQDGAVGGLYGGAGGGAANEGNQTGGAGRNGIIIFQYVSTGAAPNTFYMGYSF